MRFPAALLALCLAIVPAAALAAGVIETALTDATTAIAITVAGMIVSAVIGWAAATSERFAGPARAKSPEERSLLDRAVIEADKRIDALNRAQLEAFIANFVASKLDEVLTSRISDPLQQAEAWVGEAFDAFRRRNPQLSATLDLSPNSMAELIAAGIGRLRAGVISATGRADPLAAALRAAGASAVDVR